MRSVPALLVAILAAAVPAAAQERPIVTLSPPDAARWDAAGQAGWQGADKAPVAPDWNNWSDAAAFSATLGYRWTTHLKLETTLTATTDGRVPFQEPLPAPGAPFPVFRYGEHRFRTTSVALGAAYQFFENAWFHPFAGAGVEVTRERDRLSIQEQITCGRGSCTSPVTVDTAITYRTRPYVTAGFKGYVSEHAFIRSDVSMTAWSGGADTVRWRAGIGVDF